jgi:hypothetical protein
MKGLFNTTLQPPSILYIAAVYCLLSLVVDYEPPIHVIQYASSLPQNPKIQYGRQNHPKEILSPALFRCDTQQHPKRPPQNLLLGFLRWYGISPPTP